MSDIRQCLENACDDIDASIFTGGLLYCPDELEFLEQHIARWQREIARHKVIAALVANPTADT